MSIVTGPISKLELRWEETYLRCLDFIIDGSPLRERIPWRRIVVSQEGLEPKQLEKRLAGASTFSADGFVNLPLLASKLKQPTRAIDRYLVDRLSAATKTALRKYQGVGSDPASLQAALTDDLNSIITRSWSIYDADLFAGIYLRPRTQQSLSENPKGENLQYLNRLLLEDAYMLELERISHGPAPKEMPLPTRLGIFIDKSGKWWREGLAQLLMEKPGVGEDGGCPLFACAPECLCEYVSARIEQKSGLFLWRHFAYHRGRGYTTMDIGPFYFEPTNYLETLKWACSELTKETAR